MSWQHLGQRDPTDLVDARLQSHWAAQTIASVGMSLISPHGDDSHTNSQWLRDRGALAGH